MSTHPSVLVTDISFAPELLLDLARPASTERLPLLVWLHGGAWRMQDRTARPDLHRFASAGYVCVSIDYRLSSAAPHPAQLLDVRAALRFLRERADEYGIDPARIGLWGSSAGGHLAALAGLTGDIDQYAAGEPSGDTSVQAVIDGYGPADLAGLSADAPADAPELQLLGGPVGEHLEAALDASPARRAHQGAPPILILHGDADLLVPAEHSERLYDALAEAGSDAALYLIDGFGHGFLNPGDVAELGPDHVLDVGRLDSQPDAKTVRRSTPALADFTTAHPHASFDTAMTFFDHVLTNSEEALR
ncbi:alpha/beta hydrolase fold domain-containing protein (plasmid) [Rathayibacter sp. VKM Ac-2803]|uniref:alpha/beta hydrolase n=1 Tax=Rathayibacter TaxID=33886 RepID=UPI001357D3A0|nr:MULTISPECIES: alpha/beta hydrolase [Rathayibacter]MWV51380.1 alpha/beta hydrolase fold domain-containing protein [Rathayibacter sp. VKM Ac-2803]